MMPLLARGFVAAFLLCVTANTFAVTVTFNVPEALAKTGGTLTLRRTASAAAAEPVVLPLDAPRTEIAPGVYLTELRADGWWMAPRLTTIREDATIDLVPRRTGSVEGTLNAEGLPVTVRFEDPADPAASGEVECAVREKTFRCQVPEGSLDLRVGVTGHVPHYRWGVSVPAAGAVSLGALAFVTGSSLSGRLRVEEGTTEASRITLVRGRETLSAAPSANGFFQFGPVPAGDYTLTATRKGLVSAPVVVTIAQGHEARLRDPVLLARPRSLELSISPAVNPIGRPWIVSLTAAEKKEVAGGAASLDGSWRADHLPAGTYALRVRPDGGPVWHVEDITIDDPLTTKYLVMKGVPFRATVRLGSEPLAANVTFGGKFSPNPIPFRSGESGEIKGYLPAPLDGLWRVLVQSDHPKIEATLPVVNVATDDAGVAHLDIVVPATGIEGEVIGVDGKPVKDAFVNISGSSDAGGLIQVRSDAAGKFMVQGIPAGTYGVSASAYLVESRSVPVTVEDDASGFTSVQLRLEASRKWSGRITLPDGRPVAGARITAVPVDVPVDLAFSDDSTAEGRFTVVIPGATRLADIRVSAHGFTFGTSRRPVTADPLNIVVDPRGATLLLDYERSPDYEPVLWHGGVASTGYGLMAEWIAQFDEDVPPGRSRLRIPQLEPGEYRVCLVPAGQFNLLSPAPASPSCRSVYLAPFAQELVRLSAP